MHSITEVLLPNAFEQRNELHYYSDVGCVRSAIDIGELINHPAIHPSVPEANVLSTLDWNGISKSIETIYVDTNACNDQSMTVLDLNGFNALKCFLVETYSFSYVTTVKIVGLPCLERVVIAMNSFTQYKNAYGVDSESMKEQTGHRFSVKYCEKLKELKIGRFSFADYSLCEIENLNALKEIQIGLLDNRSDNFYNAVFRAKSE